MTKIIAITNQKGGVGKTTTAINLAASLGATKRRILLIDFDPQGNATMGSGIAKLSLALTIKDALLDEKLSLTQVIPKENRFSGFSTDRPEQCGIPARRQGASNGSVLPVHDRCARRSQQRWKPQCEGYIQKTAYNYDLLPANADLTAAEISLLRLPEREYRLKNILQTLNNNYDFIFIDCPPALNILTINALVAADAVLIPMQCEYYALEGLAGLLNTIEHLQRSVNPNLKIAGLLRTMYDGRNRLTLDVAEELKQDFAELLYNTIIPRNVRLAEAPSHGAPALFYDKNSPGALAYLALAGEILRRSGSLEESI